MVIGLPDAELYITRSVTAVPTFFHSGLPPAVTVKLPVLYQLPEAIDIFFSLIGSSPSIYAFDVELKKGEGMAEGDGDGRCSVVNSYEIAVRQIRKEVHQVGLAIGGEAGYGEGLGRTVKRWGAGTVRTVAGENEGTAKGPVACWIAAESISGLSELSVVYIQQRFGR